MWVLLKFFISKLHAALNRLKIQADFNEIKQLKEDQVHCIVQYLLWRDVFAVLPTGFGKSIIFR